MVKTQTKVTIAFLGAALISLAFWDRSSKVGLAPQESAPEAEEPLPLVAKEAPLEFYDPDRVIHRSKRNAANAQFEAVFRQLSNMKTCCNVLELIPQDALDACDINTGRRVGSGGGGGAGKKKKGGGGGGGGGGGMGNLMSRAQGALFGNVGSNNKAKKVKQQAAGKKSANIANEKTTSKAPAGGKKDTSKTGVKSRTGRQASSQKIGLKFVVNSSALDLSLIESTLIAPLDDKNSWKSTCQEAMYTCEEPAACAMPDSVDFDGRKCNIKPVILYNCMMKQMLLNCPSEHKEKKDKSAKCKTGLAGLKALNTLSFG